jgi:hypothetical protein
MNNLTQALRKVAWIWNKRITLTAALCLAGYGTVQALPITYQFSSVGSGRLGANSFSAAAFTILAAADTSQIYSASPGVLRVPDLLATVSIYGLPTATFNISTINVDNQSLSRVGFSDPAQGLAILFVDNPAFAAYDLSASIGPLLGSPVFNSGAQFGTTSGYFSLTSVSTVTFQAVAQSPSVPDKVGTLGLLLLMLSGCLCLQHRLACAAPRTERVRQRVPRSR